MSPLTPLDVETLQFRAGLRGYDKQEVEQFRAEVMQTLVEYIDQIGRLRMRIGEMDSEVARYRETEDLVKSSVMLAQRSSEEIINAAKDRAQALIEQARAEGEKLRQDFARVQNEREQFEYEFHALLSGYLARLQSHNPRLLPQGAAAPAAAKGGQQASGLEAALNVAQSSASAAAPSSPPPAPTPMASQESLPVEAGEAAPAAPRAWNIITAQASAQAAETVVASAEPAAAEPAADAGPPEATAAAAGETPARAAIPIPDQQGSTFHAFSEPDWRADSKAEPEGENKRDADIDDFTRALEGKA